MSVIRVLYVVGMKMAARVSREVRMGLFLSFVMGSLAGCGVVYSPQEFEKSYLTYGYKGVDDIVIEVIPLTFTSARAANADNYVPKTLPESFSEVDTLLPPTTDSLRDRLEAAGAYNIEPPIVFEVPPAAVPYDSSRESIQPLLQNEQLQPLPYIAPLELPIPGVPYETPLQPQANAVSPPASNYILGSGATPYAANGNGSFQLEVQGASSASSPAWTSRRAQAWGSSRRMGRQAQPFPSDATFDVLLERPQLRQSFVSNPLPFTAAASYRIGTGDVLGLQFNSFDGARDATVLAKQANQPLLVQDNGDIFIAQVGAISVAGMTIPEARRMINERIVASGLGLDPSVEIIEFGSQRILINGLQEAKKIPISIRPVTLSEVIISVGGFGPRPDDTIVRVQRDGEIYQMTGSEILASNSLGSRILVDGDLVAVTSGYDPSSAMNYFNQQLRLREIDRNNFSDNLAIAQDQRLEERLNFERQRFEASEQRAEAAEIRALAQDRRAGVAEIRGQAQERRAEAAELRAQLSEVRAEQATLMGQTRLELELRQNRLDADRRSREFELSRLRTQRETDQRNEDARINNVRTRQAYLDRLRDLEELNRETLRQATQETRRVLTTNQSERVRVRSEKLRVLELELRQEQARINQVSSQRQQSNELFNEKLRLGAIQQDYVTVAGETNREATVPLPFGNRLTLNRVLYGQTRGINPVSGDTSEIYIIRTPSQDRIQDRVIAYHLNATNPAALAVASMFELRPNDVVYVNPQPITKWNRVLNQILPSTGLVQSGITAASGL